GFRRAVTVPAVRTPAAEGMEGDIGHAAHAYYPRLCGLLKVTDVAARHRLESGYRRHAELLWSSLNEWLSAVDGKYGRPSPPANDQVRPRGRRRHPHPRSEPDGPP